MAARRVGGFGGWARERREAQGFSTDKEFAAALHDELGRRGDELSFDTVKSKLSKLLGGDPEGAQLIETALRFETFAVVLGVSPADLTKRLAARAERVTLVLDPALSNEVRTYFRARGDEPGASFDVCEANGPSVAALHQTAITVKPSRPLIVLSNSRDKEKLEVTGIDATDVRRVKRGWVLGEPFAELVPPPPRPDPVLRSEAGERLYPFAPDDELVVSAARRQREGWGREVWARDLSTRIERDEWISVPLARAFPAVMRARGLIAADYRRGRGDAPLADLVEAPNAALAAKWLMGEPLDDSYVWFVGDRLLGMGPAVEQMAGLFSPHHTDVGVVPLRVSAEVEEGLRTRNPYIAAGSEWWAEACARFSRETGVDLGPFLKLHVAARSKVATTTSLRRLAPEEERSRRAELQAIARRRLRLSPRDPVSLPFQLDALASAPLLAVESDAEASFEVIGNVGAGWLLRLRVQRFLGERPAECLSLDEGTIDGGDIRAWLTRSYEDALEGFAHPARARRRAEAQASADDDEYYED